MLELKENVKELYEEKKNLKHLKMKPILLVEDVAESPENTEMEESV